MRRLSPRLAGLGLIAAVLAVAVLLSQTHVRLASSQAVSLVVKETDAEVPADDPLAAVWNDAAPVEIPLSAQNVTVPMGGGSIRAVKARALHDDDRIYFRLEWEDTTEDTSAFKPEDFRDAAAIQFPATGDTSIPSFCMGQADGQVNIWQWKADWQVDIDRGFVNVPQVYPNAAADYYPFQDEDTFYPGRAVGNTLSKVDRTTPVEDLVAAGFGTLTSADSQNVQGKGVWANGKWYVLFVREMKAGSAAYVPFTPGQTTNVAFAVWNGSNGDRDGLKSVSQFAELKVEGVPGAGGGADTDTLVVVIVLAALVVAVGVVVFFAQRRMRAG